MNFRAFRTGLYVAATITGLLVIVGFGILMFLFITQPSIVPAGSTFGSFWLKNFSLAIAALAFVLSAATTAWNSVEQRHLRYMETYPYIELVPFHSVDPISLPVPKVEVPHELAEFNTDYLKRAAPGQALDVSDTQFRYFGLTIRNVGHGQITKVKLNGSVEVPGRGFPTRKFSVERRFNLQPGQYRPFTVLPIGGLPEYRVRISSIAYNGHFVELRDFEGAREFGAQYPFVVPPERREKLFSDEFENAPTGLGWVLDFWGSWGPTDNIHVPIPSGNEHYLILRGDTTQYKEHFQGQAGVYKDLPKSMSRGQTVQINVRVRATPGTTAQLQIWCHDMAIESKNRYSRPISPGTDWEEITMLYTSTQAPDLRVHLLYFPGMGEIHVDRVSVEGLYT